MATFYKRSWHVILLITVSLLLLAEKKAIALSDSVRMNKKTGDEAYEKLPNGIIKNEISFFISKARSLLDTLPSVNLIPIPMTECSDSSAFFDLDNWYASSVTIYISSEKIGQQKKIKEMLYTRVKYGVALPDSAFNDISNPVFCTHYTKKGKPIASNWKAYRSEDHKRVYIYTLSNMGKKKHEVTWVIVNNEYYTRVIDIID